MGKYARGASWWPKISLTATIVHFVGSTVPYSIQFVQRSAFWTNFSSPISNFPTFPRISRRVVPSVSRMKSKHQQETRKSGDNVWNMRHRTNSSFRPVRPCLKQVEKIRYFWRNAYRTFDEMRDSSNVPYFFTPRSLQSTHSLVSSSTKFRRPKFRWLNPILDWAM